MKISVLLFLDRIYWYLARGEKQMIQLNSSDDVLNLHHRVDDLQHAFPSIELVHHPYRLVRDRLERDIDD